jgi:hypothetical protein
MSDDAPPPRAEDDATYQAELKRLHEEHDAGRLTTYDLNVGRRTALAAARERLASKSPAPAAAASPPEPAGPPPPEPVSETAAASPPEPVAAREPEPVVPSAWSAKPAGPKHWSEGGRGDDPSVRIVHPPVASGVGDGKAFLFLFGLKRSRDIDQQMIQRELAELDDDIAVLREAGYTVVVDPQGSKQDFLQAIYGEGEGVPGLVPAGIYWSAHGHDDGSIECCDAAVIRPDDVDTARVSPGLKLMVFGACYTGAWARTWRTALGGHPLVVGWGRPVTIERAVEFLRQNPETDTDLDDLIARYLIADVPVPALLDANVPEAATKHGRKTEIVERLPRVAGILGAKWREADTWGELWIPLPEERHHVVRLFVTHATHEYSEGKALVGVEAEVGELTQLVETRTLLRGIAEPGYARIALVRGRADLPDIVAQGFVPLRHATDLEIASLCYQIAVAADRLEHALFGGDRRD